MTTDRVRDLVSSLTLDQKVAQLTCIGRTSEAEWLRDADVPSVDAILERHPDGVGQLGRPSQKLPPDRAAAFTGELQRRLRDRSPHIGALFNEEGIHGHMATGATHYPAAIALASTWDPEFVERVYAAVATEVRARGSNYVYAPDVDLARDPRWGRVEETFGEDPHLVASLGAAAVRGLQGTSWAIPGDKVLACAKHFVAHGIPEGGRNAAPIHIGERELRTTHLIPFRAVCDAGVGAVMAAYHDIDGIPCHVNTWLLTDVLRDEWEWEGMVSSDGYGVPQVASIHGVAADERDAAVQVITAGVDTEVPEGVCFPTLAEAVRRGDVDEVTIDRAVARVLTAKERLGLLDEPTSTAVPDIGVVNCAEHRDLALEAARRSAVLVINDDVDGSPLLPIEPRRVESIAVIGPNAAGVHLGGYSDAPGFGVSVLDGITERFRGCDVRHAEGCRIHDGPAGAAQWWEDDTVLSEPGDQDARIDEAARVAAASDLVIMVIGGDEATAREAWADERRGDRDRLDLPGRQDDLLRAVAATGRPMVAVVMGGRPLDLGVVVETCAAVLAVWYPGQAGGMAIAEILAGDVDPSGRLPISVPRSVGQIPSHSGQSGTYRRRYLFTETGPRFPFGHGLSYTTFSYGAPSLDPPFVPAFGAAPLGMMTTASVDVTNTGTRRGSTVVQCYVGDRIASVVQPERRLAGFTRITLDPGQTATATIPIGSGALSLLDREMTWRIEPGEFDVWVGPHSGTDNGAILTVA